MPESLWSKIKGVLKKAYEWLDSDKPEEAIGTIASVVGVIIKVIALFNAPLSNAEAREMTRQMLKFFKYADIKDLEELIELKRTGALDNMQPEERDVQIGVVTSAFIKHRRDSGGVSEHPQHF